MDAVLLAVVLFIGITYNLYLVTRLDKNRRREVADSNRRLDDVATRAAETARVLASYHVQVMASANRVADTLLAADITLAARLQAADQTVAEKLRAADLDVADRLQAADSMVADKLESADAATKPVSIDAADDPVPVQVVTPEPKDK